MSPRDQADEPADAEASLRTVPFGSPLNPNPIAHGTDRRNGNGLGDSVFSVCSVGDSRSILVRRRRRSHHLPLLAAALEQARNVARQQITALHERLRRGLELREIFGL